MSTGERRRHERYVVTEAILVVIDDGKTVDSGSLVDVSENGCYVATPAISQPGERVTLLVQIPEGEGYSLRLAGMVAWRNTGEVMNTREGYGLEFLYDPNTRRNAQKLLQALAARGTLARLVNSV